MSFDRKHLCINPLDYMSSIPTRSNMHCRNSQDTQILLIMNLIKVYQLIELIPLAAVGSAVAQIVIPVFVDIATTKTTTTVNT